MTGYEFPASFAQRRMWLLARLAPDEPTYNVAWALWLDGALDTGALHRAWAATVARHEALRTTFRDDGGVPVQVIDDDWAGPPLSTASVEQAPGGDRAGAARALVTELARTPIDPATGPLVRAALVRVSARRHVLAVVAHHIVADGWSFRILFDELSGDYAALRGGGEPRRTEPPIQYADYAIWQIEHADAGGFARSERYFGAELAGAAGTLSLPVDQAYPARPVAAAGTVDAVIPAAVQAGLRRTAADLGASWFSVLLAGYALLLAHLSGEDDLVVAVPMAARTRPETEAVVGMFMNTVPVRVRVRRDAALGDLVRSVHESTARVLTHQDLPLARIVELLRPERDPARLPLAQVMFAVEESWAVPDRGGLRWEPELVDTGTVKFEVELTVTDAPDEPRVHLAYNAHLFRPETGALLAGCFERILRLLATDPGRRVADAEPLPPRTRDLVTRDWPGAGPVAGPRAGPRATGVSRLWRACAGERIVVRGGDGALSGAQVRSWAARIADALRRGGVGPGDRVGILLPRGARLVPAVLGVWSVGASYVPLDAVYPARRLSGMLDDAGARAILVDGAAPAAPQPPPTAEPLHVVDVAGLAAAPRGGPPDIEPQVPPAAGAYTMFTSGSTGRPKAVTVTQGNVGALLDAVAPLLALGPRDRFVAVSTFAFDIALVELVAPVLAGACVVVADAEQAGDGAALRRLLADSGATALQATPATWRMLVHAGGVPGGVRLRMTAGEPLPRDLADAIGAGEDVRLWNLYGPTETTIYSAGAAVEPAPAPIEVGPVIAGTRLYVLDRSLRPVAPGVLGEVCVGGAGVASGYHGMPALTAARFVPDPFGEVPGARLYRTGDLGRWRPPGRIALAGRADRQFKIRGYRVESGDVESALREHPDVAQAVVSVRGSGQDVRLVGYLVTRSGTATPPPDLAGHLRERLPYYMVPAAFVVLPRLPLTRTGKIDHRALPEPDWAAAAAPRHTAPRTPVEAELATTVADLLRLAAPVGVTDNFFALGGHSLTATQLMARIRSAYDVDLPVWTLFAAPTVAGLAAAVAAAREG